MMLTRLRYLLMLTVFSLIGLSLLGPAVLGPDQRASSDRAAGPDPPADLASPPVAPEQPQSPLEQLEQLGRLTSPGPVSIPFVYEGKHILVPMAVPGAATSLVQGEMLLDSGARATVLDRQVAGAAAFLTRLPFSREADYGLMPQVAIAEASFSQMGAFIVDFQGGGPPLACLSDTGLIGANWMRHGVWQLDYGEQLVTVAASRDRLPFPAAALVLPLQTPHHLPLVSLVLNQGPPIQALVDTGWNGGIYLSAADYDRLRPHLDAPTTTFEAIAGTLAGPQTLTGATVEVDTLTLGDLTLTHYPVDVSQSPGVPPYTLVGNDFLEHFSVTLDWPRQQLALAPLDDPEALYPPPLRYGFQATVQGDRLQITGLHTPSPMEQAGIAIGDVILRINGDDYTHLEPQAACQLTVNPIGDRYRGPLTVTVLRQDQILTFRVFPAAGDRP